MFVTGKLDPAMGKSGRVVAGVVGRIGDLSWSVGVCIYVRSTFGLPVQ